MAILRPILRPILGPILTSPLSPSNALVGNGLLACYDFAQGSGQQLTDRSGNGYHGQLGATSGADATDPAWATAGLVFDGSDDYVNVDSLAVYNNGTTNFTAIVVVKGASQLDKRAWAEGSSASDNPIIGIGSGTISATTKARFFVRDQAGLTAFAYESTATVFDNAAYHSLAWSEANGVWQVAIDGAIDGSGSYTRPTVTLNKNTIGALGRAAYAVNIAATVAAAVFYNRALDAAELLYAHRALKALLAPRGVALA